MQQRLIPGNPPIPVTLRRNPRARRLSLRVSRLDGQVTLTMPSFFAEGEAMAFAQEKTGWIRRQREAQPGRIRVGLGTQLPVEGDIYRLTRGTSDRIERCGDTLRIPDPAEDIGPRVAAWLKKLARRRIEPLAAHYAGAVGRDYGRLSLRDTRSRWGSCTAAGNLMLSWRLILAPPEVLDYVVAHEAAHLVHMDHSPRFWAELDRIAPDYARWRAWLRKSGPDLHRYLFQD